MFDHASPENSRVTEYCPEPTCDDPENPGFPRPVDRLGYCATHRRQKQRTGKVSAITEKVSPLERLINLGHAWLNETENDDREKVLRRRFLAAAKGMPDDDGDVQAIVERFEGQMRERRTAAALRGVERARQQGKRLGRPRKSVNELDLDELVRGVFNETKSVSATARALGLNRRTVRDRLSRNALVTAQLHPEADGPRRAG